MSQVTTVTISNEPEEKGLLTLEVRDKDHLGCVTSWDVSFSGRTLVVEGVAIERTKDGHLLVNNKQIW